MQREKNANSLLREMLGKKGIPVGVIWSLTEKCPLRCKHCFVPTPKREKLIRYEHVVSTLDELKELGVIEIIFTGGDPLVRNDFLEIIRSAIERRFWLRLKTSGVLLTDRVVNDLLDEGMMHLDLSLYNDDSTLHDSFVGKNGAWEKTVRAARRFVQGGGYVTISIGLMGWNCQRVPRLVDFCQEEGFAYSLSPQLTPRTDGDDSPLGLVPTVKQISDVMDELDFGGELEEWRINRRADDAVCRAGLDGPCIQPNGDVRLCQSLEKPLGNIRDKTFGEIWENSEVRKQFLGCRWGDLRECRDCELADFCNRCPASALAMSGDICGKSEIDCYYAKIFKNYYMRVIDEKNL